MADRTAEIDRFLQEAGVAGWDREALPADASTRRYVRLARDGSSLILMDADPAQGEPVGAFVAIARHLLAAGLHAPQIHATDGAAGLLLLEDLGPETAAAHLLRHPQDEVAVYTATAEALAAAQAVDPPGGLVVLGPAGGAAMLAPFFDWFDPDAARGPVEAAMRVALAGLSAPVLSLRDLHAENIVWQPDLAGLARVGLLDFQDAWRAPPAYDLASLLDDPRREVSHRAEAATLERFAALTAADPARTEAERAILSVQRNLRILGIFARLIRRDGKPRYAAFVPRTIRHLHRHLAHPALGDLRPLVAPRLRRTPSWA